MKQELNAILTIAYRDFTKLLRDRPRLVISFIFPFLFIGILGTSLQENLGTVLKYNYMTFVFTGVLGQVMFQSTASGIISLIEDRENDFSQEIFVSPISRYSIIVGKILGETLVSLTLVTGVVIFGMVMAVPLTIGIMVRMIPALLAASMLGGAFGIVVLANLNSQRTANQLFPLIIFPQFFLAGVFNPIMQLPWYLDVLSHLTPMRYAVDLVRNAYYAGNEQYSLVVLNSVGHNLVLMSVIFVILLVMGTWMFVRNERNR